MGLFRLLYRTGGTAAKVSAVSRGPKAMGRNYVRRKLIKSVFRITR